MLWKYCRNWRITKMLKAWELNLAIRALCAGTLQPLAY